MKIIIIGNRTHTLIKNFALWLRRENQEINCIDIFSLSKKNPKEKKDKVFDHTISVNFFLFRIPIIKKIFIPVESFFFRRKILKVAKNYDIIQIHFIENILMRNAVFFEQIKNIKIVITIWGSDFNRRNDIDKARIIPLLKRADCITFTNEETKQKFRAYYRQKHQLKFNDEFEILRFGLAPLEKIKTLNATKENSKDNLKIPKDRIAIAIGYNASQGQQHIEIIRSLIEFENSLSDKIILLFPVTYGGTKKYILSIKKILDQTQFKYIFLTNYMSDIEVAHLRNACDIMIQLQTTDQFSGSMLEHMYALNIVITGSWLPYKTLEQYGGYFRKIDSVNKVGRELKDCLNNQNQDQEKIQKNKSVITQLGSWDENIKLWSNLYKSLLPQ